MATEETEKLRQAQNLPVNKDNMSGGQKALKRILDFVLALGGIIVLLSDKDYSYCVSAYDGFTGDSGKDFVNAICG